MADEKPYKYDNLPIPTYEEATSSRTTTPSLSRSNESGNDEERRGLLGLDPGGRTPVPTRRADYRPPGIEGDEANRDSLDDVSFLPDTDRRDSTTSEDEEVRREMQEMEVEEPPATRSIWGKRISSLSQSLHFPFKFKLPNWKFKLPRWDANLFIIMSRIFAIALVLGIVYVVFISDIFTSAARSMTGQMYDPERVRIWLQDQVDPMKIREYLEHITAYDHLAGTEGDFVLGEWVEGMFITAGLENIRTDQFDVYLNYAKEGGRRVELIAADGSTSWAATIEEETVYSEQGRQQAPVFHGHSKTGNAEGPLIYANYGSRDDFRRLSDNGIETTGAIAIVRSHGSQERTELKVKAAEDAGFVACLVYNDPADDGFVQGQEWPNGRYMPSDGVQRSAVSFRNWVVGDVLTPGWPSTKGAKRLSRDNNPGLPNIPSIPLSWRDASVLLKAVQGMGEPAPTDWQGGIPDVDWWSGNLSSPVVRLQNDQDEVEQQPIWNIMGEILGVEQKEKNIIVGSHRDAWAFGASPGSGTAVMLEVMRVFGDLVRHGWRPLRTIQFASWDGSEYNLIGSTEYVESSLDQLRQNAFAYINLDVGVTGSNFRASASPVFKKALLRILNRTSDPFRNETLRNIWDESGSNLQALGSTSDYVAFQNMAGTSSIDMGFYGEPYPQCSVYDNFEWMDRFGDPGFQFHQVLGQILALLILAMADTPVLPFDMTAYSAAFGQHAIDLANWVESKVAQAEEAVEWSSETLTEAVLQFQRDARQFEEFESEWETAVYGGGGFETVMLGAHRMSHNNRMSNFETHLLDLEDGGGIPGREQFKHILFGPRAWSSTNEDAFFAGIKDAVEAGDWALARTLVERTATILSKASHKLVGNQ